MALEVRGTMAQRIHLVFDRLCSLQTFDANHPPRGTAKLDPIRRFRRDQGLRGVHVVLSRSLDLQRVRGGLYGLPSGDQKSSASSIRQSLSCSAPGRCQPTSTEITIPRPAEQIRPSFRAEQHSGASRPAAPSLNQLTERSCRLHEQGTTEQRL